MGTCFADKKITVTGGAGFIGSHLVDSLVHAGAKVTVIDNLLAGRSSNLKQSASAIRFIEQDVRDREVMALAVDGADMVFHLAGNASVPDSVQDPRYDFESNVLGTQLMLEALIEKRIGRVLFSSTAAVYGAPQYVPTDEKHPVDPISPYGASKLAAERLGVAYARALGIEFVVARIYNTFGPRQRRYVMYDIFNKLHKNPHELTVLGDGTQVRDYTYVADTVRALMTVMERGARSEVYNIAGGNPIRIRELVHVLAHVAGHDENLRIHFTGQSWIGDVPVMVANIEKLCSLGFAPSVGLIEGLNQLHAWMKTDVWNGHVH